MIKGIGNVVETFKHSWKTKNFSFKSSKNVVLSIPFGIILMSRIKLKNELIAYQIKNIGYFSFKIHTKKKEWNATSYRKKLDWGPDDFE